MKALFIISSIVGAGELLSLGMYFSRTGYEAGMSSNKMFAYEIVFAVLAVLWVILNIVLMRLYEAKRASRILRNISKKAKAEGMTSKEYIHKDVPERCIEVCECTRGMRKELDEWLKFCVNDGQISKEARVYLFEEYRNNNREDKK